MTAQALPPQRVDRPFSSPLPPQQPVPVQVVPPMDLNPQISGYGGFNAGGMGLGDLGVVGPPGVVSDPASRTASDPPAARPGVQNETGPLPNAEARVSLRADDQDVREVLGLLGRDAEVNILISPAVEGSVRIELNEVTFRQALDAVLKLASLGARQENGLVYVYTLPELDALKGRERQPMVRVYHLNYVRAADLQLMIQPFLSSEGAMTTTPLAAMGLGGGAAGLGGGISNMVDGGGVGGPTAGGGVSNAVDTGGNTMAYHDIVIVRDYADNLAVIDEIVKRVDVQPPQVLIEAVILSVRLRDAQELGVNFSIVDNLERLAVVSGNGRAINNAAGFSPAQVLAANVTRPGPGQLVPGYLNPLQGLKFGFISNNVTGFIRAVEAFNKVNILASPRILVLNKQRAEIQLGQRLGFRNTVTNLTSSLQTVEFLSVGTLLALRPYVSNDGMIRLEVHPEKSTGALDSQGIPQTNTSELTTNILVPDGATIVIGGLIDDEDTVAEEGTPGLNRLPVVGALFRGRVTTTTKNELIVLLTPRVLRRGGLPEPVPGVAPRGVMGLPNSGAMPGPSLGAAGLGAGLTDETGQPLLGMVVAPPPTFRVQTGPTVVPPELPALPLESGGSPFASGEAPGSPPLSPPASVPANPPVSPVVPEPPAPALIGPDSARRSAPASGPATTAVRLGAMPATAARPNTVGGVRAAAPSAARAATVAAPRDPAMQPARVDAGGAGVVQSAVAATAPGGSVAGWRHVVKPGEGFVQIAQQYYGTPAFHRALWAANRSTVAEPGMLRAGQTIVVPPAAALDLSAGELPAPLTDRERARTPVPRQHAPASTRTKPAQGVKSAQGWPGIDLFRRREANTRTNPSPASTGPAGGLIRPPGPLGQRDPAVQRAGGIAAPQPAAAQARPLATAEKPRGYRPGDLTRALVQRLARRPREESAAIAGAPRDPAVMPATGVASMAGLEPVPERPSLLAATRPGPIDASEPVVLPGVVWPAAYYHQAPRGAGTLIETMPLRELSEPAVAGRVGMDAALVQRLQSPDPERAAPLWTTRPPVMPSNSPRR
jgi:type IV pilus secretin PilQ/predicted competence protein